MYLIAKTAVLTVAQEVVLDTVGGVIVFATAHVVMLAHVVIYVPQLAGLRAVEVAEQVVL